jgi:large subunit ribosomal protein L25
MASKTDNATLEITTREPGSSRSTRRLRREGKVPGVLYGLGQDPLSFTVDARELRHALAGAGAVVDLAFDGSSTPAVLKDSQRHPVRGEIMHVDLLRVDLNKAIHAVVSVELTGVEDSPGAKEGGIVDQITREVNVEALPNAIPESISFDVSTLEIGDTLTLEALVAPEGVTLLDNLEETTLVTVAAPRVEEEPADDVETETELVGEDGAEAAEGDDAGDGDSSGDDAGE